MRRRARRTILALVPGELEKEEKESQPSRRQQLLQLRIQQQIMRQLAQGQQARAQALAKLLAQRQRTREDRGAAALAAFGVTGKTRRHAPWQPGLAVRRVRPASAAERLGLRAGDLIVKVNGRATSRPRDFALVKDWKRVAILVLRGGKYVYLPAREARR